MHLLHLFKDFSISALVAGFVTVLIGVASSVVIVIQAAQALGANPAQVASWVWALSLGMGVVSIGLSLYYRAPIALAWSTSGAAMLLTSASGVDLPYAVGAFVMAGCCMACLGFSGWFDRVVKHLPASLAAAMLAGVLLRFGLDAFTALTTQFWLVSLMLVSYLLMRRWLPRYAVVVMLGVGWLWVTTQNLLHWHVVQWQFATPVWVTPQFNLAGLIGITLPLFVVTLASQNLTGLAVLKTSGYVLPAGKLVGWTGLVTLVLAPFGAFSICLATITAAICTGKEAHENPAKRYVAAVCSGFFYILFGWFAATLINLLAAFPKEMVVALAGFSLLGPIGNGLASAFINKGTDEHERDAALIAFLLTASGVSLFGIGSAFWGLFAGVSARVLLRRTPA